MMNAAPRRVVVTGLGIVSCIGNSADEVTASLRAGKSGITFSQEFADRGFKSQVWGKPTIDLDAHVDRRARRFMGDAAAYTHVAMAQAIADSGLTEDQVSNERAGVVVGSGGPSTGYQVEAADILRETGSPKRIGPFFVPRCMSSTCSATLATNYKIKGLSYSISSACSTSAHCIGNAAELIQMGKQDIMFAGGGEDLDWTMSCLFDAMGALSSKYNDTPSKASRAYDANRDGFVIAGGGGILVLEELEHARARGAKIYAEITGYGATSDGEDMVAPNGEGATRCMKMAISTVKTPITYINTHGTSTAVGDPVELGAIKNVFGDHVPFISSTKSMTGHSLGATGVQEAIYCLLMMQNKFMTPSINIETLDPVADGMPILREIKENVDFETVLSNSFGFGGTNCTLALTKWKGE